MLRYFLVLAVTDGSLLTASFVVGLIASGEPRGPHDVWRAVHLLIALLTVVATLGVHSIVYTYFLATGKWAKEVVHVYGLPNTIEAESKRLKRKTFRYEFNSMCLIAVVAWLGGAADTQGTNPLWHLGAAAVMLAYNLLAFVVEYRAIEEHSRLLADVKTRADLMRAERYGIDLPDRNPAGPALVATSPHEPTDSPPNVIS